MNTLKPEPIDVIFFDIDGVLATKKSRKLFHPLCSYKFDEKCVNVFNKIIDENPDVKLVMSSSWRYSFSHDILPYILIEQGINIHNKRFLGFTPNFMDCRWLEIKTWINNNLDAYDVKHFAIIDDDLLWFKSYPEENMVYIQNGMEKGLEEKHIPLVNKIIRGEQNV